MTFTQLPFQILFLIAVAAMGQPVYQICRRNVGTLRIDAHLIKPSVWRSAFRAQLTAWRTFFNRMLPITAALILMIALAHVLPDHADAFAGGALLIGQTDIRELKNRKPTIDAQLAARAVEMQGILGVAFDKRDDAQKARISAIETERAALTTELAAVTAEIALQEKYLNQHTGGPSIQVGKDRAEEKPWAPQVAADAPAHIKTEARHMALGTFAMAVKAAAYGDVDVRLHAAATGAGTQSDSNLGFAIPNDVAPGIEREMYETGEILSRVDGRPIAGNNMTYNVVDETSRADGSRGGGVTGYWVDEGTAPTASNTKVAKMEMKLRKVGAFGVMTDELLSDATALGGELESAFAEELTFQIENKIYRGNGSSAPLGFLNAPCLVSVSKETNQAAATINTTNIVKMWARMRSRSKANAVWLYNTECGPQLNEMAQAIGTGGTSPRFVTYDEAGLLRIHGRPAIEVEYAEAVGTVGDLSCVNLKKYRLIRKGGIEQASSMHVYFAQGEQAFRAFARVDGQAVLRAPLTPFKGTATLSDFVVLATRS